MTQEPLVDHRGDALAADADLFAPAPPDLGVLRSVHSSLTRNEEPTPTRERFQIMALSIVVVALLGMGILYCAGGHRDPDMLKILLVGALVVGSFCGWAGTSFEHQVTYVGSDGFAEFHCAGTRTGIVKSEALPFAMASELRTKLTDHIVNGQYEKTEYRFQWGDQHGDQLFVIEGSHSSRSGNPSAGDRYHFARAAETAWSSWLLSRMTAAPDGSFEFTTRPGESIAIGPGYLEIRSRGQRCRCDRKDVARITIEKGELTIQRTDAQIGFFSSEGVFKFQYGEMANARVFLLALATIGDMPVARS